MWVNPVDMKGEGVYLHFEMIWLSNLILQVSCMFKEENC